MSYYFILMKYYQRCLQVICVLSNLIKWCLKSVALFLYTSSNIILYLFSHFPLSFCFSYGFEPPESAVPPAVSVPGATGQVSPRGHLQGPCTTSVPQHHLLPRCMHQALCHQEGKRSVRRLQRPEFTCVQPLVVLLA